MINVKYKAKWLIIQILLLFIFSCKNAKEADPAPLKHKSLSDTIRLNEGYFVGFNKGFSLIDMKFFDDTVFLWAIIERDKSYFLDKYTIEDSDKLVDEKVFSNEMKSILKNENCEKLFIINSDSLIISTDSAFYFYSTNNNIIYKTIKWDDKGYFTSRNSPFFYDVSKKMIYSEYSDRTVDYMEDIKNKKKIVRFAQYNIQNDKIKKITANIADSVFVFNPNMKYHFVYANDKLISKGSFQSEFQIYDTKNKSYKIIDKPCLRKKIDNANYQEKKSLSYQYIKKKYMESYIQQGLCYDYQTDRLVLLLLNPVPKRDENGLKPDFSFRSKSCFVFDKECYTLGLIETKANSFIPNFCFTFNQKIYLLSSTNNMIKLYIIDYEL